MPNIYRSAPLLAIATACSISAAASRPPLFGDWWYPMPEGWRDATSGDRSDRCAAVQELAYDTPVTLLPVNQPGAGHGGPGYEPGTWMADYAICLAKWMDTLDAPIGLLIRERNCPFPYGNPGPIDPLALENALDVLPKLDYLFMDLEAWGPNGDEMVRRNVEEIYRLVREHPNPMISRAAIGNYNDWPGETDEAAIWSSKRDRLADTSFDTPPWDRDLFYNTFFDVAMPIAYPYEIYSRHSDRAIQGNNTTPNDRAAIFWAPLERVSVAARSIPSGHALVPWISNFVDSGGPESVYHAPPPSAEDLKALIQHIRLRGSDSFMIWTPDHGRTSHPTIDYEMFRSLALDAWTELDDFFGTSEEHEFLNLKTNKVSGVQWSAVRSGSEIRVLVSNLHHARALEVQLPAIDGLPSHTPKVQPGEHATFTFSIDPAVRDFEADGDIDRNDFVAYITRLRTSMRSNHNSDEHGPGIEAHDINASGHVDLLDVIAVLDAFRDGKFNSTPGFRSSRRGAKPVNSGQPSRNFTAVDTD